MEYILKFFFKYVDIYAEEIIIEVNMGLWNSITSMFSSSSQSKKTTAEKAIDKAQNQGFDGLIPDDAKERLIRDSGYLSRVKRA